MKLPADPEGGREEFISFDSPIGLLKELLTQHGGSATIDKLTQSLQHQTGVTWNNRYKKQHGTLGKVRPSPHVHPPSLVPRPFLHVRALGRVWGRDYTSFTCPFPLCPSPCAPSPSAPPPCAPPPCAPPLLPLPHVPLPQILLRV